MALRRAGVHVVQSLDEMSEKVAANAQLVAAFGSGRRLRTLNAKAAGRVLTDNVSAPDAVTQAIKEIGKLSEQQGTTTAQVRAVLPHETLAS